MALVNCPECRRENVSDTAESCPDCGFNIKEYFRAERVSRNREIEENKKKEIIARGKEAEKQRLNNEKEWKLKQIENLTEPVKPILFSRNKGLFIFFVALSIALGLFGYGMGSDFCIISFYVSLVITAIVLLKAIADYSDSKSIYKRYANDLEGYKKYKADEIEKAFNELIKNVDNYADSFFLDEYSKTTEPLKTKAQINETVAKCPTCGSTDIKKISTTNRAASVIAVGLASGKIGKQFECKNCGYKW